MVHYIQPSKARLQRPFFNGVRQPEIPVEVSSASNLPVCLDQGVRQVGDYYEGVYYASVLHPCR